MAKIYKLQNQTKHYEWGSKEMLPQFLGIENVKNLSYAEMWMGTHSGAPSRAESGGTSINLKDIAGELPFLFKLLGVGEPLSVQAHPSKTNAADGFRRENEAGLALNAPLRNYKDTNHKPEIICAITPFTLMAGFKEPDQIHRSLEEFLSVLPQLKEVVDPLIEALYTGSLAVFFRNLYLFSDFGREYFSTLITNAQPEKNGKELSQEQWRLMKDFASHYPGDPAILSPLFLNIVTLKPFQAIYIPEGVLHAYLYGLGAELMANSDNSIRGGLTPKHVNIPELMNVTDFKPFFAGVFSPGNSANYCYPSLCDDFSLSIISSKEGETELCEKGPVICLVVEGECEISGSKFKKGESFFIPDITEKPAAGGNYTLFTAASGDL